MINCKKKKKNSLVNSLFLKWQVYLYLFQFSVSFFVLKVIYSVIQWYLLHQMKLICVHVLLKAIYLNHPAVEDQRSPCEATLRPDCYLFKDYNGSNLIYSTYPGMFSCLQQQAYCFVHRGPTVTLELFNRDNRDYPREYVRCHIFKMYNMVTE